MSSTSRIGISIKSSSVSASFTSTFWSVSSSSLSASQPIRSRIRSNGHMKRRSLCFCYGLERRWGNCREKVPKRHRNGLQAAASVTSSVTGSENWEVARLAPGADPESITEWELDFCSRPIFDSRGKKIWELLVCDRRRNLEFSKFFPNNVINSITLKEAIVSITQSLGVPKPQLVRFFRSQMQTIVSKACNEIEITPIPSRRCFGLMRWLEERYESIYMSHPGFQEGVKPLPAVDNPFPLALPESLQGERWAFVQLSFEALQEEIATVQNGSVFGSVLDLNLLGIECSDDILIPGIAVASSRAMPLAACTNSLEIASIDVDIQRGCLTLSAGVSKKWIYAYYKKSKETDMEAEAWVEAKKACRGLHFLAIQDSLDSESCAGFWLILDVPNPPI
eukprot:TRINITY_DN32932_c0_g1_i1.p1 TRINITY_DN32932_c0_g1~~TRINITY_DN32932_c0_g1_i1.p1  ORF type:complete len:394 (-),score=59.31 TRINITY_DN32932_c0_g1_i1:269-1450(-)